MGKFLTITYESQGGRTAQKAAVNQEILSAITDGVGDYAWQDSIAGQVTGLDRQYSHIAIGGILRLFHGENIEAGGLRSYARYLTKDDKLVIDQMLATERYEDLSAAETLGALCDDVLEHFETVILRYRGRFADFDAAAFVPLLRERVRAIEALGTPATSA